MSNRAVVTVLMPVWNGARYLAAAIESILAQSFQDFELLLIDDGSVDESIDIERYYAAIDSRVLFKANCGSRGVTNAMNLGLQLAAGEFIARLDQDDIAMPNRLTEQVSFMRSQHSTIIVGANMVVINANGDSVGEAWNPERPNQIRLSLLFNNALFDPTVMYRTRLVRRHHLVYDAAYTGAEDYAFWSVLLEYGQAFNLQAPLTKYRIHERQMSRTHAKLQTTAAERVSNILLQKVDPFLSLTWSEKQLLKLWCRCWFRKYMEITRHGWWPSENTYRVVLKTFEAQLSSEQQTIFTDLTRRCMLERVVRGFVEKYGDSETSVKLLLASRDPSMPVRTSPRC